MRKSYWGQKIKSVFPDNDGDCGEDERRRRKPGEEARGKRRNESESIRRFVPFPW